VKILVDQNLSPRLCDALRDLWPAAIHVRDVGLHRADDSAV
jgi:predicted nuclease of predicted toxin-antitoxin system